MSDVSLAEQVGQLLRLERERAGLCQRRLAELAGVSQQRISQVERANRDPGTAVIERLFRALGQQLRLDVEPLDSDLDGEIDLVRGSGAEELEFQMRDLESLLRRASTLRYLIDGELAARLHGVPIPTARYDLAVAEQDLPALSAWVLTLPNLLRWNERWRDFSDYDVDPLRPGPLRWLTVYGELRVRLLPALPAPIRVSVAGREWPVRPLPEVERDDPRVARFAARVRARGLLTGPTGTGTAQPAVDSGAAQPAADVDMAQPATGAGATQSTVGSGGPSSSSASTMV